MVFKIHMSSLIKSLESKKLRFQIQTELLLLERKGQPTNVRGKVYVIQCAGYGY